MGKNQTFKYYLLKRISRNQPQTVLGIVQMWRNKNICCLGLKVVVTLDGSLSASLNPCFPQRKRSYTPWYLRTTRKPPQGV